MRFWRHSSIVLLVVAGIAAAGFLLPAERRTHSVRTLSAPLAAVRATILDVEAQPRWRPAVTEVVRTSSGWRERLASGDTLDFTWGAVNEGSIEMRFESSRGYRGQWKAILKPVDAPSGAAAGTQVSLEEATIVPNPVGRIVSRLAFDQAAFTREYLEQLGAEASRRSSVAAP